MSHPPPYAPPVVYNQAPTTGGMYGASQPPAQPYQHAPPPQYSAQPQHAPNPGFRAPGRKKAVLIACSYPGTRAELKGCINDAQCLKYLLTTKFGFAESQIVMLRDDVRHPDFFSTKVNIFRALQWLVTDVQPGDSLFLSFSGHGSQQRDRTGDELDGMDETILPTDYATAGQITDDELNQRTVRWIPAGVTLHAVIDACHSGTILDLAYLATRDQRTGFYSWQPQFRGPYPPPQKAPYNGQGGTVFQFGACLDSQVAADTSALSKTAYTGAATFTFIQAVEKFGPRQSYGQLLQHMHEVLKSLMKKQGGGGGGGTGSLLAGVALLALPLPGLLDDLAGAALMGHGISQLTAGGRKQTPVLCCDKPFDLNSPLSL